MTNTNSGPVLSLRLADHWKTIFNYHQNQSTCDLVFVCDDGSKILAHKMVIFLAVPDLYSLVSHEGCQQQLVIFIPDVKESIMKHCLEFLYETGDASLLLNIFGFKVDDPYKSTVESVDIVEELLENIKTEPIITMFTDHDEGSISGNETESENPSSFPANLEEAKEYMSNLDTSQYIFTNYDIDQVVVTNICYDAFHLQLFNNLETARRIVQIYNENHKFSLIIKSNNSKALRYQCYCGTKTKSSSQGIRKVTSNYTGCPAKICFYKKANGLVKMTQIDLKHNHELKDRSHRGTNKAKVKGFDWDTAADAVVRDGVISNRTVQEMELMMQNEGISPLPTIGTIRRRTTIIKKFLGIFPEVKESIENKEQERPWKEITSDNVDDKTD